MNKYALTLGILLALPFSAMASTSPVAMLETVAGTSTPTITPYTEVAEGTKLVLEKNATATFVHYQSCKEVTVVGGTIDFDTKNFKVTGGSVTENQQPCPERVAVMSTTSTAGGLVMRGTIHYTSISNDADVVVIGHNAVKVSFEDQDTHKRQVFNLVDGHIKTAGLDNDVVYQVTVYGPDSVLSTFPVRTVNNASPTLILNVK